MDIHDLFWLQMQNNIATATFAVILIAIAFMSRLGLKWSMLLQLTYASYEVSRAA
jgi:hypothetical protein